MKFPPLLVALLLPLSALPASWTLSGESAKSSTAESGVSLSLSKPGEVSASAEFPVKPSERLNLSFSYVGDGLAAGHPASLVVRWKDASGADVDAERLALGFPPVAKIWTFTTNSRTPIAVSDNLTAPDRAVLAVVEFALRKEEGKSISRSDMSVTVTGFALKPGEAAVTGIEVAESGPADAGPLSQPPSGVTFGVNLVPNGALEDGTDSPIGWKVEGDNRNNSAEWLSGGAFSGRRAFKLTDRGPYVKSWDRAPGDPFVQGGAPTRGYAKSREEVSARWVTEQFPATPGASYQIAAFYWYANRSYIDRGVVNPVRIQFFDSAGKIIHPGEWDDWLPNLRVLTVPGWVFVMSKPVPAPAKAATMRVVVAMHHAFWDKEGGQDRKRPDERGFLLVDNIAVYQLPPDADLKNADRAFASASQAGRVPYVPSSAAHRPGSVSVTTRTEHPGGLIVIDRDKPASGATLEVEVGNYLGDNRKARVTYEVVNIDGQSVGKNAGDIELSPFGTSRLKVALPSALPYGPYLLRYTLAFEGEQDQVTGVSRFGTMPPRDTSVAERGRMDYPFSLWMHTFDKNLDTPEEVILGRLAESAGVGKTWFGVGNIYPNQFMTVTDPAVRKEAIAAKLAAGRKVIAAWKKYGVTPMAAIQPTDLLKEEQYPLLAEIVTEFVSGFKDDGIKLWRHGTESMHGGVKELDRATVEEGTVNGQGGRSYLYWGREGTVRQYWAEYFVVFKAAKKADPDCIVGPQVASDIAGNVLRLFFQLGTASDFDIFGMNTYISAFSIWPANVRQLQEHDAAKKPLFASEFSAGCAASPVAEDHLALEKAASQRMVAYWTTVLSSFPTIFHLEQWGMRLGDDDASLTYRGEIRPQYLAYATMTNMLGSGTFTEHYDLPAANLYVRERTSQGGSVGVLWSKDKPIPVDIQVDAKEAIVVDLWGNRQVIPAKDGVVTIEAGPQLVYVVGGKALKPAPGVAVEVSHATTESGKYRLKVTLLNERTSAISGDLEIISDGPLRITDRKRKVTTLEPGKPQDIFFDVEPIAPLRDDRTSIRVRLNDGTRIYETAAPLNFHSAPRAQSSSVGEGTSWNASQLTMAANTAEQFSPMGSPKPWGGPDDLSALAGFQWDDKNLYLRFEITDDLHQPPEAEKGMWNRDVIELLIDVNRKLVRGDSFTMFSLAEFPDGPRLQRWDGPLPQGLVPGSKITVAREGSVTIYDAAIPWSEIDPAFKPHAGKVISLCWSADDHDGGNSRRRCISWFSPANSKNAAEFGDLILVN